MCTANFQSLMAKAGKLDLGGRLTSKVSKNDLLTNSLGYAGVDDPLTGFRAMASGQKTEVSQKATAMGLAAQTKRHQASSVTGTPGHVQSIAARKARAEF